MLEALIAFAAIVEFVVAWWLIGQVALLFHSPGLRQGQRYRVKDPFKAGGHQFFRKETY